MENGKTSELAIARVDAEIQRFAGATMREHVDTWERVEESIQGHLWMLGAIAASVRQKFGRRGVIEFARDVKYSARRIEEIAATYEYWKDRERSQILSFGHHTIAQRADEPETAIETAEHPPGANGKPGRPYSQRELAVFVAGENPRPETPPKTSPAEPDAPTIEQQRECYDVCDKCGGRGVVWIG